MPRAGVGQVSERVTAATMRRKRRARASFMSPFHRAKRGPPVGCCGLLVTLSQVFFYAAVAVIPRHGGVYESWESFGLPICELFVSEKQRKAEMLSNFPATAALCEGARLYVLSSSVLSRYGYSSLRRWTRNRRFSDAGWTAEGYSETGQPTQLCA